MAIRRRSLTAWLDGPFGRLVRHSVDRIFAGSESAEPGELDLGIGTVLAILAVPGAFAALIVSDRYSSLLRFIRGEHVAFNPYVASVSDEYFFVVLAMVIAAAVAVWKWDRLLPDRRDFQNLSPLPVSGRTIFVANISAILLLAAVLSLDVNAVSCVLFPAVVTLQSPFQVFLTFCATHAATVLLAGAFGFLSVFAVMGVMMSILPYQLFRKSSLFVRCALLFSLAALLSTAFTVPQKFSVLVRVRRPWTAVPPPAWFLGLCESMRKSGGPVFGSLAAAAVWSLTLVFVLALAAFSLSFRRTYLSSGESTESRPSNGSPASLLFRWLDRVLLKSAFDRGCYRFALRAIFRSQEHAFIFGMFGTVGVVLASQALIPALGTHAPAAGVLPSVQILSIPLILGFFLILGLYTAFSVPAPLRSNWVFRFNVDPQTRLSASLARKIVYTFLVPLLFAPCLIVYSHVWGWEVGLLHTGLVAAWCTLLLEGLLVKFRKIPFTCSAPGFKSHAIITALTFLLGYFVFTSGTAAVENWAFGEPALFAGLLPIVLSISFFFYRQRKGLIDSDRRVTFEDKPAPVVEAMNLVR